MNVLKIAPESALKFMAYEQAKRFIRSNSTRDLSIYERFIAGSLAGGFSQTIIYPLEVSSNIYKLDHTRKGEYTVDFIKITQYFILIFITIVQSGAFCLLNQPGALLVWFKQFFTIFLLIKLKIEK